MLFTVILEFGGLTSVSQFIATNPDTALLRWEDGLSDPLTYGLRPEQAQAVARVLVAQRRDHEEWTLSRKRQAPFVTAVSEVKNVWCVTFFVGRKFGLINIIATNSEPVPAWS